MINDYFYVILKFIRDFIFITIFFVNNKQNYLAINTYDNLSLLNNKYFNKIIKLNSIF